MANKTKTKKIMPLITAKPVSVRPGVASTSMLAASAALRREMAKVKAAKTPAAKAKQTADVRRMSSAIKRVALALPQRTLAPATRRAVESATQAASALRPVAPALRPVAPARKSVPVVPATPPRTRYHETAPTGSTVGQVRGRGMTELAFTTPRTAGSGPLPHSALLRAGVPAAGRPSLPGVKALGPAAFTGAKVEDDGYWGNDDDYDNTPGDTSNDGGSSSSGGGGGGGGGGYYSDDYGTESDGFWADEGSAPYAADDVEYEDEYGEIVELEDDAIDATTAAAAASAAVDEGGGLIELAKAHPIISALVLAGLGYGGYRGYQYWQARRAQG